MSNKATAVFDAEDSRLMQAFNSIDHHIKETTEHFHKLGEIGEGVLTLLAAEAIFEKIKEGFEGVRGALEMGEKFHILSQNTGVAVSDLVVLSQAFRSAGKEGEDVGAVLAKMSKSIVSGSANETLELMHVNLEELKKAAPLEQFETLGKSINAIKNPTERAAAAIAIFGKTGAGLLSLFAGKGLEEAGEHVGRQAAILGEDAALFRDVAEKLDLVGTKVQGFFVGVADEVAPVLQPLLERFAKMDFSKFGQQAASAITIMDSAFADGHFGELLDIQFDYAAAALDNKIMAAMELIPIELGVGLASVVTEFISSLLSGLAMVVEKIPGVHAPGTHAVIDSLNAYHKDINSDRLEKEVFASPSYDLTRFAQASADIIAKSLAEAQAKRADALKKFPTHTDDTGALSDLSDVKFVQANVSALTRVGGGFGGAGGGDPLLSESRNQTRLLQEIVNEFRKGDPPKAPVQAVGGYG